MDNELRNDVAKACRELEESGLKITQRAVIEKVGRGSFTDIGPAIKSYQRGETAEIPDWLNAALSAAASSIWVQVEEESRSAAAAFVKASQALETQIATLNHQLQRDREKAASAEASYEEVIKGLRDELEKSRALCSTFTAATSSVEKTLREEIAALRDQLEFAHHSAKRQAREIGALEGRLANYVSRDKKNTSRPRKTGTRPRKSQAAART